MPLMWALRSQPSALAATLGCRLNGTPCIPPPLLFRFHKPARDSSAVPLDATDNRRPLVWVRFHLSRPCSKLSPPAASGGSRWCIDLPRRQGLAHRLRPELVEDRPQRADARRERVTIVL